MKFGAKEISHFNVIVYSSFLIFILLKVRFAASSHSSFCSRNLSSKLFKAAGHNVVLASFG